MFAPKSYAAGCVLASLIVAGAAYAAFCPGNITSGGPTATLPTCTTFVASATNPGTGVPAGNDANSGLTPMAAFATLAKAQTVARTPGRNVVCLRAGTFNQSATIELAATDSGETWQYYQPDGVNTAVIDGGGTVDLFRITQTNNLTFNGLKMLNPLGAAIHSNFETGQITGLTIINNEMAFNHGNVADGFDGPFPPMIGIDNSINMTISNNYIHDTEQACISFGARDAGTSINGTVISGNVLIRCVQTVTDGGAIEMGMFQSGNNGGSVTISNNYIRDWGANGVGGIVGIYLDDNSSHTTVTGNVIAPPTGGWNSGTSSRVDAQCYEIHNGGLNTISGNICDLGATARISETLYFQDSASLNGMGGNVYRGNINIMSFGGANNTAAGSCATGVAYCENSSAINAAISNNAYHNYGGGSEATNGSFTSDSSPQHYTVAEMGLTCTNGIYSVGASATVSSPPVSFPTLPTHWGPPGFTIPASTNHSC